MYTTYIADNGTNEGTDIAYDGSFSSDSKQSRYDFNHLIIAWRGGVRDSEPFQYTPDNICIAREIRSQLNKDFN